MTGARLDTDAVSCTYAFLTDNEQRLYTEMLTAIRQRMQFLNIQQLVTDIMGDFELGALNAVKAVFGNNVTTHGCFFHLCQSTWKRVRVGSCNFIAMMQLYEILLARWMDWPSFRSNI